MAADNIRRASPVVAIFSAIVLVASFMVPAAFARQAGTPEGGASFDALLQCGIARGLTGIALYIERGDEILFDGAAGLASQEKAIALTPADRFRIYSITKTFTATLILQLVDEGVLSLDDTVGEWLGDPAVRRIPNIDQITIRQLLQHTSGVYDYFDAESPFWQDAYLGEDADWSRVWSPLELLAYADGANHAPYAVPGESVHYANTGYILLGLILEAAAGQSVADLLQARILDPLGLGNTLLVSMDAMPAGVPDGYQMFDGQLVNISAAHLSAEWTAGGMLSTTHDLARFVEAIDAGELLPPAILREMTTVIPSQRPGIAWGLGISRMASPAGDLIGMGGAGPGFQARMFRLPAEDLNVVLLTNTNLDDDTVDTLYIQVVQDAAALPMPSPSVTAPCQQSASTVEASP